MNIQIDKFMKKDYTYWRKHIYASINGTKGNMVKLVKSDLLSKEEKWEMGKVIAALEELRKVYYNNRGNKTIEK